MNSEPSQPTDTPDDQARPLTDHLEELRRRLFWSVITVAAASFASYYFTDYLIHQMARLVGPMVFLSPTEAILTKLKLAFMLGTLLSMPFLIYHLWRYIGVALTVSERRIVLGALPFSYLLFMAGVALSCLVVTPAGLRFLVSFGSQDLRPLISVQSCLEFVFWMSLGMGIVFQLPVVIAALARWGFLRAATLRLYRRHAVVAILILAAILTPGPDMVSQLLMAVPTYLLFEISVWVAAWVEPKDQA